MRDLGEDVSPDQAAEWMNRIDPDRSGDISFDEWYKWWQAGLDAQGTIVKPGTLLQITSLGARSSVLAPVCSTLTQALRARNAGC